MWTSLILAVLIVGTAVLRADCRRALRRHRAGSEPKHSGFAPTPMPVPLKNGTPRSDAPPKNGTQTGE